MDSVKLMNRVDTKFVFNRNVLEKIFPLLHKEYKILHVNGIAKSKYTSLYFDTDQFLFFLSHHNGRINRAKVRFREYIDSQVCFLEIKRKNAKGKTVKKRIKVAQMEKQLSEEQNFFVQDQLKGIGQLRYCHENFFHRITMVGKTIKERITIDFDLEFKNENESIKDKTKNIVIAEVKQEKLNRRSFFYNLMRRYRIRSSGMSKYCVGTSLLNSDLKANRFKRNFRILEKNNN